MRLIDADRLKTVIIRTLEALNQNPKIDGLQTVHMVCAFDTVGKMVDNAPTIDAVVLKGRCKDCQYWETNNFDDENADCGFSWAECNRDGYCHEFLARVKCDECMFFESGHCEINHKEFGDRCTSGKRREYADD